MIFSEVFQSNDRYVFTKALTLHWILLAMTDMHQSHWWSKETECDFLHSEF